MNESELNRVKKDLETVQDAVGLGLPFTRKDIWAALGFACWGLIYALCGILTHGTYHLVAKLVWISVGIIVAFLYVRSRKRSKTLSPAEQRELSFTKKYSAAMILLSIVFIIWARKFGMSALLLAGSVSFFVAAFVLLLALTSRRRLYFLGFAIPLMLYALIFPLLPESMYTSALIFPLLPESMYMSVKGAAICVAGLATAAILTLQLRETTYDSD
ncbi:MAG: hypothetical protein ACYTEL_20985 [Planctomycetota bacterium]